MLAAVGLGAVGALALKALGVSLAALLLAGLVALKKLTEGGGDGGHQVHYVSIYYQTPPLKQANGILNDLMRLKSNNRPLI